MNIRDQLTMLPVKLEYSDSAEFPCLSKMIFLYIQSNIAKEEKKS